MAEDQFAYGTESRRTIYTLVKSPFCLGFCCGGFDIFKVQMSQRWELPSFPLAHKASSRACIGAVSRLMGCPHRRKLPDLLFKSSYVPIRWFEAMMVIMMEQGYRAILLILWGQPQEPHLKQCRICAGLRPFDNLLKLLLLSPMLSTCNVYSP